MARALLAWELGANLGHLVALRAIARQLRERGHECSFAVRMLGNAQDFLEPELGPLFQAPVKTGSGRNPVKTQVSYASLLHNTGFDDSSELAGRIQAWCSLYRALKTEYVFADHSPVAMVAARSLGIPACHLGAGFWVPPVLDPFPSFRPAMKIDEKVLRHNDNEVLKELNRALEIVRLKPFDKLQDIFRGATPALFTYKALDHYEVERSEPYLGMPDYSYGAEPRWPEGTGPKVFAYLCPGPGLKAMLDVLADSKARVLLRGSGIPPEHLKPHVRGGVTLLKGSVNFRAAAESCDAFVNYGSYSTVCEFLLAGKPGVLLPNVHERLLVARRAVALGACLAVRGKEPEPMKQALSRIIDDDAHRKAAESFADSQRHVKRDQIVPQLVETCLP